MEIYHLVFEHIHPACCYRIMIKLSVNYTDTMSAQTRDKRLLSSIMRDFSTTLFILTVSL